MKILALDIGAGTEDILLYDDEKQSIENCIKMVLPSPSLIYATKVREATCLCQDLFINGDVIGGGAFASALRKHVGKGLRVVMTEKAAYSVRNNLDEVREFGIEITCESPPADFDGKILTIEEVNIQRLKEFLIAFNEPLSDVDVVAVAVQDHGASPKGMSNRTFRIQNMRELLESNPYPENLAFKEDEVPSCYLRMKSAVQASRRQLSEVDIMVMDTSPAAILGCLEDPALRDVDPILAVNVGNSHTMAAIINEKRIIGLVEHHTRLLNPEKLRRLLIDFANGKLDNKDVFNGGGHGLFFLKKPPGFSKIKRVVATGPNRRILTKTNLPIYFAAPAGDVMMTGPVGLIEAAKRKFEMMQK